MALLCYSVCLLGEGGGGRGVTSADLEAFPLELHRALFDDGQHLRDADAAVLFVEPRREVVQHLCAATDGSAPVFQLGLFLRALRPARTGLRPARFTRALPEFKKPQLIKKKTINNKKTLIHFLFLQNVIAVFVFSDSSHDTSACTTLRSRNSTLSTFVKATSPKRDRGRRMQYLRGATFTVAIFARFDAIMTRFDT